MQIAASGGYAYDAILSCLHAIFGHTTTSGWPRLPYTWLKEGLHSNARDSRGCLSSGSKLGALGKGKGKSDEAPRHWHDDQRDTDM